jgi:hypothetical protein
MSELGGSDKQFDSRRLERLLNNVSENIFERLDKGLIDDTTYNPFSRGNNPKQGILLGETFSQFKGRSLNEKVNFIKLKINRIKDKEEYETIFSDDGDLNLSNFDDTYEGSSLPNELKTEIEMFKALTNYFGLNIEDVNKLPAAVLPQ